jgi:hypothetical protein
VTNGKCIRFKIRCRTLPHHFSFLNLLPIAAAAQLFSEKEQDRGLNAERAARRKTNPIRPPSTELRGDPEARRNPVEDVAERHLTQRPLGER